MGFFIIMLQLENIMYLIKYVYNVNSPDKILDLLGWNTIYKFCKRILLLPLFLLFLSEDPGFILCSSSARVHPVCLGCRIGEVRNRLQIKYCGIMSII